MTKLSRSHSTYIERAEPVLKFLKSESNVKKISLGIINVKRPPGKTHGPFKIKVAGNHLLLEVNSKSTNQKIHIYGDDLNKIAKLLEKFLKSQKEKVIHNSI